MRDEIADLMQQLLSGDDARAEQAACNMAAYADDAFAPLLTLLDSGNSDQRWWATRTLATLEHPGSIKALQKAIRDPDPAIRQCAALGFRYQPTAEAIPALIDGIHDADRLVARLSGDALAAVGAPAVRPLERALLSPQPSARIEAARALVGIQDPQTIPALYAALDDSSSLVAYWAEEGLGRLGVGWVFVKP